MCLLRKFKSFFLLCIVCLSARITACLITIVNLINEVWTRAFVFLTTLIKRTGVNSIILRVKHGRVAGIHNLLIYLFIYFENIYLFIYLFILRTYVDGHHRMRWLNKHFVFILEKKLAGKLQIHVHGCESFAIYLKAAYRLFCFFAVSDLPKNCMS